MKNTMWLDANNEVFSAIEIAGDGKYGFEMDSQGYSFSSDYSDYTDALMWSAYIYDVLKEYGFKEPYFTIQGEYRSDTDEDDMCDPEMDELHLLGYQIKADENGLQYRERYYDDDFLPVADISDFVSSRGILDSGRYTLYQEDVRKKELQGMKDIAFSLVDREFFDHTAEEVNEAVELIKEEQM